MPVNNQEHRSGRFASPEENNTATGDSKVARREYLLPEEVCHSRKNWLPLNITKI